MVWHTDPMGHTAAILVTLQNWEKPNMPGVCPSTEVLWSPPSTFRQEPIYLGRVPGK